MPTTLDRSIEQTEAKLSSANRMIGKCVLGLPILVIITGTVIALSYPHIAQGVLIANDGWVAVSGIATLFVLFELATTITERNQFSAELARLRHDQITTILNTKPTNQDISCDVRGLSDMFSEKNVQGDAGLESVIRDDHGILWILLGINGCFAGAAASWLIWRLVRRLKHQYN